jgi:hypothetical protein
MIEQEPQIKRKVIEESTSEDNEEIILSHLKRSKESKLKEASRMIKAIKI